MRNAVRSALNACKCIYKKNSVIINLAQDYNTYQEDICTKLQYAIYTRQLFKHDGVGDLTEEASYKFPND